MILFLGQCINLFNEADTNTEHLMKVRFSPHRNRDFLLLEIVINLILAHSHHFHSTANQKFTRKPRVRGSPRPSHVVNGG